MRQSIGNRIRQLSGRIRSFGDAPLPPAPTGVNAIADSDSQITTDWTDPAATITSYDGRYRVTAGSWTVVTGIAKPWVLTGLQADTQYDLEVRVVNPVGAGSWSAPETATTDLPSGAFVDSEGTPFVDDAGELFVEAA